MMSGCDDGSGRGGGGEQRRRRRRPKRKKKKKGSQHGSERTPDVATPRIMREAHAIDWSAQCTDRLEEPHERSRIHPCPHRRRQISSAANASMRRATHRKPAAAHQPGRTADHLCHHSSGRNCAITTTRTHSGPATTTTTAHQRELCLMRVAESIKNERASTYTLLHRLAPQYSRIHRANRVVLEQH